MGSYFGPQTALAAPSGGAHDTVEEDPSLRARTHPEPMTSSGPHPQPSIRAWLLPLRWGMRAFTPKSQTPRRVMRRKWSTPP